ncbi:MAG: hypothetical protein R2719_13105 [Micropruina sp.]
MTVVPRLDWRSANVTGRLLTRPGPEASPGEVAAVAADLRASAERRRRGRRGVAAARAIGR